MRWKSMRAGIARGVSWGALCALAAADAAGQDARAEVPFIPKEVDPRRQATIWEGLPAKPRFTPKKPRRVLVFETPAHLMDGDPHKGYCVPFGTYAFLALGVKSGAYEPVFGNDVRLFLPENIRQFDAIFLNNTACPWIRPSDEQLQTLRSYGDADAVEQLLRNSLMDYIEKGGGIVGLHFAIAGNAHWPEFRWMWGGHFAGHPWNEEIGVKLDEPDHPLAAAFEGKNFRVADEIYQFGEPYTREYLRVLCSIDVETTNMGVPWISRTDNDFALAWVRKIGEGRLFYCALGHRLEIYANTQVMQFYLDGLQWVMGEFDVPTMPTAWGMAEDQFDAAAIAERVKRAAPLEKAAILRAAANYAGRQALPLFLASLKDEDAQVRMAAVLGLGRVGDASTLPVLAGMAASVDQEVRGAARTMLTRLEGADIEPAMVSYAKDEEETPEARSEMIRALGARRAVSAAPDLIQTASDREEDVRMASLKALAEVADDSAVPALLGLLEKAGGDAERRESANALAAACRTAREVEACVGPVVGLAEKAAAPVRCALIEALGRIESAKALAAVRRALKSQEAAVREASVRSLAGWPNAEPIEDLRALAKEGETEILRATALGGHVRMIGLATDRPADETCRMYEAAMEIAERDQERKAIYAAIGTLADAEALRLIELYLEDMETTGEDSLRADAETAYVDVAIALAASAPTEAREALDRICDSFKNEELVKRAVTAIQSMR